MGHTVFSRWRNLSRRAGVTIMYGTLHWRKLSSCKSRRSKFGILLLADAAGKNAAGRIHEDGEFGDVGATVCAWLGAKHPGKGAPGRPIVER